MLNLSQTQTWEEAQYDWKIVPFDTWTHNGAQKSWTLLYSKVSFLYYGLNHTRCIYPLVVLYCPTQHKNPFVIRMKYEGEELFLLLFFFFFWLGCFKPGFVFHVNALWILCLVSRPGLHKHGSWALWHVSRPGLILPLPVLCSCRSPLLSNN